MAPASLLAFGPLLKRARRAAHLTQAQLAERAGFSVVYVSMLERGARQPQRTTMDALADALGLSPGERAALDMAAHRSSASHPFDWRAERVTGTWRPPVGAFLGATPTGPLVGRERELDLIDAAFDAVVSGQGQLLMLMGDPGVGKTRLAQEITLKARAQGFRVVTGRCYEPQQTVAWYPFLEALVLAETSADTGQARLAEQWPEVARLLPNRPASDLEGGQTPLELNDRSAQQRLFWQMIGFFQTLAEEAPVVLLLDDLHWADSASLDLLQHLARHTRERRILLVGTAREVEAQRQHPLADALQDLSRDELLQRIAVRPLATEETAQLIGATLGGADGAPGDAAAVSAGLSQVIYQRSEGNAFFTRQLARALQEQGDLQFTDGQWAVRASAAPVFQVPENVRAVISQRLGRLTPLTQEILREASVLGQVIAFGDLQRMGGRGEQEVEEALEEAARSGIMRESQHESGREHDRYHFNHALTRDTLYVELSARRKRRLHRAAADAIERLPDHERRPAELSYHLLAADEKERALPYALLAGDQAEAVYAHSEAEGHYRTALALAGELRDAAREAEALEKLGNAVHLQGRDDEATELLEGALRSYEVLRDEQAELRTLAALLEVQGLYGRALVEAAVARAQTVLLRLEPSDASPLTLARASGLAAVYRALSMVYMGSGRNEDQLRVARRAVELARVAGDEAQLAWALHRLYATGLLPDELTARREILAMAERTGQTMIVVFSHNMIGVLHTAAGEFVLALPHMEQSLAVAEQRQDLVHLAHQLGNFTGFLLLYGDWPRAHATSARASSIIQKVDRRGATWHAARIAIWPGIFALTQGHEQEGRRLIEQAIGNTERIGYHVMLDTAVCLLAESDMLAGHAEQAQRRLTWFLEHPGVAEDEKWGARSLLAWADGALGQRTHAEATLATVLASAAPLFRVDALRVRGLLATMREQWAVAGAALDEALERTRAMPYPYAEAKTLWAYGRLEALRGNPAAARKRFTAALAICDRLGEGLYRKHIARELSALKSPARPARP